MQHIPPADRHQLFFCFLDALIAPDDHVRFLDAFADKMDLLKLGVQLKDVQAEGRPSFHPRLFLKIYLFGYQNSNRSSRRLSVQKVPDSRLQNLSCKTLVYRKIKRWSGN